MSQYRIPVLPQSGDHDAIVGWDNPLGTFFAQVYTCEGPDDGVALTVWEGTEPGQITSVAQLGSLLHGQAEIPPDIEAQLARDYEGRTPPTPLQRAVCDLF